MCQFHPQPFLESSTQDCYIKRNIDNLGVPRGCREEVFVTSITSWRNLISWIIIFSYLPNYMPDFERRNKSGIFIQCLNCVRKKSKVESNRAQEKRQEQRLCQVRSLWEILPFQSLGTSWRRFAELHCMKYFSTACSSISFSLCFLNPFIHSAK